ncbi:diguanylate cyclase [Halomicroarcula sp. F27]|uniref:histidine kinase n=1 Tax=Haloarcula nitratireducens TaxID=2487749 RepID=A0AAW4PJR0_9EURY|nr:diguanylate cyclase [Halomicroarcula nitratireducens]
MLTTTIFKFVLALTIVVSVTGGLLAWRERPEPGAVPLIALLAGQCWWAATLIFRIDATGLSAKMFWVDVSWIGIGLIPVAWLFFSLEYAGYTEYTTRNYVLLSLLVPAITAVLGVTNDAHHLLYIDSTLVQQDGTTTLSRTPGAWFWVIAGYTYLLGLLGAIPLFQLVSSSVQTFRGQSVTLLVGIFAPWVVNILYLFEVLPTAGVDPTPIAFAVSGVAYLGALTRFQLFGTNPSPIRHARATVFNRMQQGALVLDSHDNVVDMNPQASSALDTTPHDALGRSISHVCPDLTPPIATSQANQSIFRPPDSNRAYDVSESCIKDIHDRLLGRVITLHEISDLLRQQQRLEVLSRVFRHNIRTNTQVILGNANYLATHNSETKATAVEENALEIQDISDKVRAILDVFERGREGHTDVPLETILAASIEAARNEYPAVEISATPVDEDIYVNSLFDTVCSNVIKNAAQHNTNPDPRVTVSVETQQNAVEITVADNGPGIDDHELALISQGTETPLEHGSSFGLALIAWGTDIAGGDVTFEDNDPTGTIVTIEAPLRSQ